ncbi:hypothetical protein EKG95_25530 [Salmonella enterica subsp. enterica serovar Aqua]|uniref:Uncharacterized protein n=1 Tax=Salmonella enterica subsp. enterica serovar Aqua TaxID=1302615 RepID=A0A5X6ES88_SALET|nr:hypothetical protein [Salmonella enterica subsp. enterica serovar Aqua]
MSVGKRQNQALVTQKSQRCDILFAVMYDCIFYSYKHTRQLNSTSLIQAGVTLAENTQLSMNAMADSINIISCAIGKIAVSSEEQTQVFRRPE